MSEILLDRVMVRDTGDIELGVIVRASATEPSPTGAAIRLSARAVDESRSFAATVAAGDTGEWSVTCSIPAGDPDGLFSSEADILDCFVEVTFASGVVTRRLGWGDAGQTWLPYPTASRKLSLTKVKG